jgi:integrase
MGRPRKEKPNHKGELYEVKITVSHTFDGKPIRKSFYSKISKADAKAKAEQYKIDSAVHDIMGETFISKDENFDTWAEKVLENLKGTIKDSSYNLTYKNSITNHLIPYFGKRKINQIKQLDIQTYFKKKSSELSVGSLKKHKMALNKIFEYAVLNDLCVKNPVCMIKITSEIKETEKHTYTKEQCEKVLNYTFEHRYGLGVNLMLEYGISRSELLGIMWQDINFDEKLLHINRGVTDVQNSVTGKMEVIIGEPKNDFRKRVIPLKEITIKLLKACYNNSRFVIANINNTVCSPRTWSRRHYDVFMRDMHEYYLKQNINIPILNPHELRHTRATIWVNDGENIFAVADVLGHADLKMLRKRYAHSDAESTRKNTDRRNSLGCGGICRSFYARG